MLDENLDAYAIVNIRKWAFETALREARPATPFTTILQTASRFADWVMTGTDPLASKEDA